MTSSIHALTLHEIALRCGVEQSFVEQLVEFGIIEGPILESNAPGPGKYAGEVTLRVQRCVRLQRDLGVNLEGTAVIVELLERIESLEHELRGLRRT
jgi:chaperone modulatory protein CbpM